MAGPHIFGPPQTPGRGSAGVYERPSRRPLWIAAGVAAALAVAASALWWLT